jgi:tRNA (guanosine-2'-O-)-methyltransferase
VTEEDDSSPSDSEVLSQFLLPARSSRFRNVAAARTDALTVVLDQVHNFHNISAILRSADAFGISTIHLVGTSFEYSRTISLGSELWLELKNYENAGDAAEALAAAGYELVVLQPQPPSERNVSIPINQLPFERRLALVLGNERDGVSAALRERAGIYAHIPMFGFVESLNVSVATAITLFCSTVGKSSGERRTEPVSAERAEELSAKWMRGDVRAADKILKHVASRRERQGR